MSADIRDALRAQVEDLVARLEAKGSELAQSASAVSAYAAERLDHLSASAGQAGFAEAVEAESQAVALFAGVSVTAVADQADLVARTAWVEGIRVALGFAAQILAAA